MFDPHQHELRGESAFGAVGTRWEARAGDAPRWLLRNVSWKWGAPPESSLRFVEEVFDTPPDPAQCPWYRPPQYPRPSLVDVQRPGGVGREKLSLYCQDLAGLTPLVERLSGLAKGGGEKDALALFERTAEALMEYQKRVSPRFAPDREAVVTDTAVAGPPLLSPVGMAVGPGNQVVLLDAGFVVLHHPANAELFPPEFEPYFQGFQKRLLPGLRAAHGQMSAFHGLALYALLDQVALLAPADGLLKGAERRLKERAVDSRNRKEAFTLDRAVEALREPHKPAPPAPAKPVPPPPPPPPRALLLDSSTGSETVVPARPPVVPDDPVVIRSGPPRPTAPPPPPEEHPVWKLLTALFALVAIALGVFLALNAGRLFAPAPPAPPPPAADPQSPRHYILFLSDDTDATAVTAQVQEFVRQQPNADMQVDLVGPLNDAGQKERLVKALQKAQGVIDDPKAVADVLKQLTAGGVEFKGFNQNAADGLQPVIENQGVYTTAGSGTADKPKPSGGLLQPDGPAAALRSAKLPAEGPPLDALRKLQEAVQSYAADSDLVNNLRDKKAVVVTPNRPEARTAEAFAALHAKLTDPANGIKFAPRPSLGLYASVTYSPIIIRPAGSYTLELPGKCWWRLAGPDERVGVDFNQKLSDEVRQQLRWREFTERETISWDNTNLEAFVPPRPNAPPRKTDRKVSQFDLAVPVQPGKVVVFRSQAVEQDKEEVLLRGRIESQFQGSLGFDPDKARTYYTAAAVGGKWVGTVQYNLLAGYLARNPPADNPFASVMTVDEFDRQRKAEDAQVK